MDKFFGQLLAKLSRFFTVTTERERIEFASHIGWSIAIPAIGDAISGETGLQIGFVTLLVNSCMTEFVTDGHFLRIFKTKEDRDSFRDFATDFLTRVVPGTLYVLVKLRG